MIATISDIQEVLRDTEKQLERLEINGYSPLSKKYLKYTNKWYETKNLLEELKK